MFKSAFKLEKEQNKGLLENTISITVAPFVVSFYFINSLNKPALPDSL